jgi:hypothetical protein
MDFEAMIRLFVAPLGTKEQIVTTLKQVRGDAQEMLRFSGAVKQEFLEGMAVTQDQAYIRALAVDFFISLLNTVEAWADRTLQEIESWDDLSPDGKNERALERIRELPVATPESVEETPVPPRSQLRPRRHGGILSPVLRRVEARMSAEPRVVEGPGWPFGFSDRAGSGRAHSPTNRRPRSRVISPRASLRD